MIIGLLSPLTSIEHDTAVQERIMVAQCVFSYSNDAAARQSYDSTSDEHWRTEKNWLTLKTYSSVFFSFSSLLVRLRMKRRTVKTVSLRTTKNNNHRQSLKFFFVVMTRLHNVRQTSNNILEDRCTFFQKISPSAATHVRNQVQSTSRSLFFLHLNTSAQIVSTFFTARHPYGAHRQTYCVPVQWTRTCGIFNAVVSKVTRDTCCDSRFSSFLNRDVGLSA